jgi:hypothetical protein
MSGMRPVFDYRVINDDHKAAAEEIANILEGMNQEMLAELIKHKFQVIERPKYDMKESKFVKHCADAGVYCSIQGHTLDGDGIEYPLISICEDIRKLNNLVDIVREGKN